MIEGRKIRQWLAIAAWAAVAFVCTTLASEFLVSWATEFGIFERPSETLITTLTFLGGISQSWWFPWLGGALVGWLIGTSFVSLWTSQANSPGDEARTKAVADIRASWHSVLVDAGNAANCVLDRIQWAAHAHPSAAVQALHPTIQDRIDAEQRARARLGNSLDSAQAGDLAQIQEELSEYYRCYQNARGWVVQGARLAGVPLADDIHFQSWIELDRRLLSELRTLSGRLDILRRGITEVGWGEGITKELETLAKTTTYGSFSNAAVALYVAETHVDLQHLDDNLYIEFAFRSFNGTGQTISAHPPEGNIKYRVLDGHDAAFENLPGPRLLEDRGGTKEIAPYSEFMPVIEQRVSREIASNILKTFDVGRSIEFNFSDLTLPVVAKESPSDIVSLPIRAQTRCYKSTNEVAAKRIIYATMNVVIGTPSVSAG